MAETPSSPEPSWDELDPQAAAFYRRVLTLVGDCGIPCLVGGAFAFGHFTGIWRNTKDLDLFILRSDWERVEQVLAAAGYRTELSFPHWLAKVHDGDFFVDFIFNSGNGLSPVDATWFDHAPAAEVLGIAVRLTPAEETLWTKAFIMERERYDGADVAHLLLARAAHMDWQRLQRRFGPHWRVLLSHLVLFGFVYPGERSILPAGLLDDLVERLRQETREAPPDTRLCAGTLLSREQYLPDVEQQDFEDSRVTPVSTMEPEDVAEWTRAIAGRQDAPDGGR